MNLTDLYSALADQTRLRVLEMLHEKSRPVHELAAAFDISRPAISRHLRVLKQAGLVKEIKKGRENVYSFQRASLKAGAKWLELHASKPTGKQVRQRVAAPTTGKEASVAAILTSAVEPPQVPRATPKPRAVAQAEAPQLSFFDL